ncbi:MAG: hypothetical protein LKH93_19770 [Clostridium beijerinckii]|jgi:hypothetical protein|nr:hypothetical protein [Clostridium beijerinckii]MCI1578970.1 hypothetical protein [Clostridium beijerinckii]MCI1585064.1 hypothetical protein [Clostridium beijerinckii]MCI1624413.1 hypothetical protein [Clostridium beijerinckii]
MKIKDILSDKKKMIPLSIGILCLLGVVAYGVTSVYKNYQETQIQQAKQQHKNEQIEQAKEKVKKIVDDKTLGMKCEAKYDLKNSSDNTLTITVTFDDSKNTTINCDFKRTDDSVNFNDESSFEKVLNKFIDEEKKAEIRHTVIYDYQDMLYGMRGKMSNRWDKVKFSKNDDDYIVQETSDRFFGGNKAYLVTIDSEWIAKNGDSEWKHICLHMEYDKDNKLIDAKYGDYDKIDPDKDIKDGVNAENVGTNTNQDMINMKSELEKGIDFNNKKKTYKDYNDELERLEGLTQSLIGMDKSNVNICYETYNKYINNLWDNIKNKLPQDQYNKLLAEQKQWIDKKINKYPTCDSDHSSFDDKYGAIEMTDKRIGELLKYLN